MPIALPPNSPEVGRLETYREKIFVVRRGLARAYDALVEDPSLHISRVHHDDTNNKKYMMLVI